MPQSPETLSRQMAPQQRYIDSANTPPVCVWDNAEAQVSQPIAAEAATDVGQDDALTTPWQWFWRSPVGWLVIGALVIALLIVIAKLWRPE